MLPQPRTVLVLSILALSLGALPCPAASDLSTGIALLNKGNYPEARAALGRAYKRNPTGPQTRFWYAVSLEDASAAIKIYTELATDSKVADSLRVPAMVRLAGAATLKKEYEQAASWFARAAAISRAPRLRLHQAASLISASQWNTADSLLGALIAADSVSPIAAEAWFYRGDMLSRRDSCSAAIAAFDHSLAHGDTVHWRVAARAAALECATKLGDTAGVTRFRTGLDTISGTYLEAGAVQSAVTAKHTTSAQADRPTKPAVATPTPRPSPKHTAVDVPEDTATSNADTAVGTFTIQVGSFGTIVNAQKLQKRLAGEFKSARVVPFSSKGTTFYRVRLGSFATREEADAFAQKSLKGKNLTFSVVAE